MSIPLFYAYALLAQTLDYFVALLRIAFLSLFILLSCFGITYARAGDPDPLFGYGGNVLTNLGGFFAGAKDVVIQPDGKLLVAGSHISFNADGTLGSNIVLARYCDNGTLDMTFGVKGIVHTDFSTTEDDDNSYDVATVLALQSDGKIVLSGYSVTRNGETYNSVSVLLRYNLNGVIDLGFGQNGKVVESSFGSIEDIAITRNNKIIAVGGGCGAFEFGSTGFALTMYNNNGTLDKKFSDDGRVCTDIGLEYSSTAYAAMIEPSTNNILVAGSSSFAYILARYLPNGELDDSFSSDGITSKSFDESINNEPPSLALQQDGRILMAGWFLDNSSNAVALWRYDATGDLDHSFGSNGTGTVSTDPLLNFVSVSEIAINSDGEIILAGNILNTDTLKFAITSYTSSGVIDEAFGKDGLVTTDFNTDYAFLSAGLLQPDGKFVAVGYANSTDTEFALARYLNNDNNVVETETLYPSN